MAQVSPTHKKSNETAADRVSAHMNSESNSSATQTTTAEMIEAAAMIETQHSANIKPTPIMIQPPKMVWGKPIAHPQQKSEVASSSDAKAPSATAEGAMATTTTTTTTTAATSTKNNKKKSLVDIMAEEAETSRASKLMQEDDAMMKAVMEASLREQQDQEGIKASLVQSAGSDGASEEDDIQRAIRMSLEAEASQSTAATASLTSTAAVASAPSLAESGDPSNGALSQAEMESIQKALQAEEERAMAESFQLALHLQSQENTKKSASHSVGSSKLNQGHVRTMTRAEYLKEQQGASLKQPPRSYRGDDGDDDGADMFHDGDGFRINSTRGSQWMRADRNTIVGPDGDVRSKHDLELQAKANAHRLQLDLEDVHVGNKAFNAFRQTIKKKTVKGVAAHGHGRANKDAEKTREGALDGTVRLQITKAINNGLIEKFNGCVKEGKEAMVYHAIQGVESGGYDVAIKVFKRIQEFRNRGQYVTGDSRYVRKDFTKAGPREQLSMWTEKEFRNLVRAERAGVPVPKPLSHSDNVLFLRFLGEDGWPSPQIREIEIKKGSKKWTSLYEQTMEAAQKLYCEARLVHGDLSEYNILVCPIRLLLDDPKEVPPEDKEGLQVVLIDFGQAVDHRHPDADDLLERDLRRVKEFFERMGITCVSLEASIHYVKTKGAPLRPAA
mmetsp:Transcript_22892/g.64849  ORF Transcript_22892/g.64849 Transcript_22892/m.64849 type:complete len:672 (-) Transcript_22892:236-2251(-)|eukprot:CAMPEP_0119551458 /NCGR_PEP_ID=MMETSP1352-20130426/4714_1 /TAXON_ID=265584 /ORGANISM="Stauroneis constricta, Strain CCMP1120" /LENGTH=671 /DNA_ID=CAMNT_0007597525 /DNA_START=71 /DNA_END=2086 /DNA_ORIENTATION=+